MAKELIHLATDNLRKRAYDDRVKAVQSALINDPIEYCPICGMMEVDRDLRSLEPNVYGCYMCGWKIQMKPIPTDVLQSQIIVPNVSLFKHCAICGHTPIECQSDIRSLYVCTKKRCRRTIKIALVGREGMGLIDMKRRGE